MSRIGVVAASLLLVFTIHAQAAAAATISVSTTADEFNSDGDCSFREAIEAANTNAGVDACATGELTPTVDVIDFTVTGTITLGGVLSDLTDDLKIHGPGASALTISGADAVRILEINGVTVEIRDVTLADGFSADGAAIAKFSGTLAVANSAFTGNSATDTGGGGGGGAILSSNGPLTVTNSTFSGNSANNAGGAIMSFGGLTVSNSSFSGSTSGDGGAIYHSNSGGASTVTNSSFSQNSSGGGSGGAIENLGGLIVTGSTFFANAAGDLGGAILNNPGHTLTVTNSTFSDNSAGNAGGAIHNYTSATLTLTHSTLSENSSPAGAGLRSDGSATLRNTIIASASVPTCDGTFVDDGGNLQSPGTYCGATISTADPLLDPAGLQANGGPTETILLQPDSPAIGAAVTAHCTPTDQRGIPRPQGSFCDSGAVVVLVGYPRPKGATPLRVPLVPAYLACSSPNRTHGPPLAHSACVPPAKLSQYATIGTPDANGLPVSMAGFVVLGVQVGNSSTATDEADVSLDVSVSDVRSAVDLSDYAGELSVSVGMRATDRHNGPSPGDPATVVDSALSWAVPCAPTTSSTTGSMCGSSATADAIVPGLVREDERTVWALKQIQVADGGDDGLAVTTGDNTPFLKQGIFVP